jgi:dipicolinate synthase subunit A
VKDGKTIWTTGFEKATLPSSVKSCNLEETIAASKYLILPIPPTKDGKTLNAPFSKNDIVLDDDFAKLLLKKRVFCSMPQKLIGTSSVWNRVETYDYSSVEEFAIKNASLTAQAALGIAINEYNSGIIGSKCLVCGFGRIGKALSLILKNIGANVTVSARKPEDLAWLEALNLNAVKSENIFDDFSYDIVLNTVPFLIFSKKNLYKVPEDTLIIDLASAPGGTDFEFAKIKGIKAIHALSLPGKVFPKEAGEIIKNTIYGVNVRGCEESGIRF